MEIHGHGFLDRVRYRMGWAVGSGLIITALLCTSIVDHVRAATSVPTGINRTVPKVSPPTELTFSSPPRDAEFLRTGLFAEPLAPVAETTAEENRDLAQTLLAYRDAVRDSGGNDA